MKCCNIKCLKNILLHSSYKYQYHFFIFLTQNPCRFHSIHLLMLKQYNLFLESFQFACKNYKGIYNSQKSLIVCGQGAWEEPLLESTRWLDTVCCQKGIHTRFEYWGYDVDHDWPWWYKMVQTYLPWFLG